MFPLSDWPKKEMKTKSWLNNIYFLSFFSFHKVYIFVSLFKTFVIFLNCATNVMKDYSLFKLCYKCYEWPLSLDWFVAESLEAMPTILCLNMLWLVSALWDDIGMPAKTSEDTLECQWRVTSDKLRQTTYQCHWKIFCCWLLCQQMLQEAFRSIRMNFWFWEKILWILATSRFCYKIA